MRTAQTYPQNLWISLWVVSGLVGETLMSIGLAAGQATCDEYFMCYKTMCYK